MRKAISSKLSLESAIREESSRIVNLSIQYDSGLFINLIDCSWENLGTMMTAPLLLVAGDNADTLPFSQAAYDADNGPKELYLVKGATHVDLYDKEPFFSEVVVKLADFFNQNLNNQ